MSDIIGSGWNFPLKLNSRGGIALASDEEHQQSLARAIAAAGGGAIPVTL